MEPKRPGRTISLLPSPECMKKAWFLQESSVQCCITSMLLLATWTFRGLTLGKTGHAEDSPTASGLHVLGKDLISLCSHFPNH